MQKYPSIEQFRSVIREVRASHDYRGKDDNGDPIYSHIEAYPILKFKGTVKLHGTNAAVAKYKDGRIEYQSRSRELTLQSDNAGFMLAMANKDLDFLFEGFEFQDSVVIFGEWCGQGIQKGVAIAELPRMFVIFGVKVDDNWVEIPLGLHKNYQQIYSINQFDTFEVDIDFNQPELIQNKLIELTLAVEELCPVGSALGVDGIGEGIVFACVDNPSIRFKSKGEKHSVSKVKTLNAVDVEEVENIAKFIENVVTENRLNQGLDFLRESGLPLSSKSTGDFLRWVANDVFNEEFDTIIANQLNPKKIGGLISAKARVWFLNNLV